MKYIKGGNTQIHKLGNEYMQSKRDNPGKVVNVIGFNYQ